MASLRLKQEEEERLNKMISDTGLSKTDLIKKCLFEKSAENLLHTNILPYLGKISTDINLTRNSMACEDYTAVKFYIDEIEREVTTIWQSLK